MKEYQLIELFERIKMHYPSFSTEAAKRQEWLRLLKDANFSIALSNLDRYVLSVDNKYPPHPGILAAQPDLESDEYHEWMRIAGDKAKAEWRDMVANAVPPSPEVRRKVRELFEK